MFGFKTSAPARPVVLLAGVPDPVRHPSRCDLPGPALRGVVDQRRDSGAF